MQKKSNNNKNNIFYYYSSSTLVALFLTHLDVKLIFVPVYPEPVEASIIQPGRFRTEHVRTCFLVQLVPDLQTAWKDKDMLFIQGLIHRIHPVLYPSKVRTPLQAMQGLSDQKKSHGVLCQIIWPPKLSYLNLNEMIQDVGLASKSSAPLLSPLRRSEDYFRWVLMKLLWERQWSAACKAVIKAKSS